MREYMIFFSEKNVFFVSQVILAWFKNTQRVISIASVFIIIGLKYLSLGCNFTAKERLRIETIGSYYGSEYLPVINIGNSVSFNTSCHLVAIREGAIGDNSVIDANSVVNKFFREYSVIVGIPTKLLKR